MWLVLSPLVGWLLFRDTFYHGMFHAVLGAILFGALWFWMYPYLARPKSEGA